MLASFVLLACTGNAASTRATIAVETISVSAFGLRSMSRFHLSGASSGPLDGLALGMPLEEAWERAPALRDAFRVEMEASEYEAIRRRIPGLGEGTKGGNRFWTTRSRSWRQIFINGVGYELRFDYTGRLKIVILRFPNAEARDEAIADWGPPLIDERWRVWVDEVTETRAAATDCSKNDVPAGCLIEFMPFRTLMESITDIFPNSTTLVGRTEDSLPFGPGIHWSFVRYYLVPLPAELWRPLEVQFDNAAPRRRVVAYRTAFEYTYAVSTRESIWAALQAAVPDLAGIESTTINGKCWVGTRAAERVEVCNVYSHFIITVGKWTP